MQETHASAPSRQRRERCSLTPLLKQERLRSRTRKTRLVEALASRFTGRAERSFERSALPPLSSEERVLLQRVFLRRARPAQTRRYGNLSLLREAPFLFSPSAVY
ncbi:hypothetical protein NDU88_002964 [Pleurodeles waltl]|uniref:Uncharacterized protein n=1 Tax=Pleurodeles waltl TaxID=8319 RepID=A0AAV7NNE7_PLEWA|nr:hypothetical protein NDU88_002964 [Pleurodeles waltl]